ncbi:MFS transporter [Inquilinus limosus]|uniref:MFS transporter n=1 Tax=Inquilinus limosus TaxID=171674 RepID=UPI000400E024|nr:MFS transporter [Inquilinus limosus]
MAENGGFDQGGAGGPGIPARAGARQPSARSRRGLDWFVFFVADVQTGFGAFVAVFLTTQKWTQVDIGLVLTVSGLVGLIGQMPLGALVDAVRSVRITAAFALVVIGVSAFAFAIWPIFPVVFASRVLHAAASIVLSFCIVSLSLGLVGGAGMSERLGRNAAFASAGTGIAAAVMGLCGLYVSSRAVFLLAAALVVPALFALSRIRAGEIRATASFHQESAEPKALAAGLKALTRNRTLVVFAVCIATFHLANAAMMPLAASMVTLRSSQAATAMVAAAMIVPQLTVTFLSPWIGRGAQRWGRRPFLAIGFAALALRALLFAMTGQPHLLVVFQVLDGVSAAVLGVLVPLTVADVTRRSGHFNLAQGVVGSAMGLGASVSTVLGGFMADNFGSYAAFMMLAAIATVGLALLMLTMPETKPETEPTPEARP